MDLVAMKNYFKITLRTVAKKQKCFIDWLHMTKGLFSKTAGMLSGGTCLKDSKKLATEKTQQ